MPRTVVASTTRVTARTYAASRMLIDSFACSAATSWNERLMMRSRREFTSASSQKNDCRSCTHSKYETMTPPELATMSGAT